MNEDEKKAIAFLRFYVSDDEDEYFNSYYISKNIIETILHLIDKQQKEIKARLKEIDSLYKMMSAKDDEIEKLKEDYQILKDDIEGHNITYVDTPEFEENYISKDKIKEEIKEVENREENYTFDKLTSEDIRRTIITNLEELLGK